MADAHRLIVIGGGNMAHAILRGGAASGVERPASFVVCDPDPQRRSAFEGFPFEERVERTTASIAEAMRGAGTHDQVMLAVKPQMLGEVAADLRPALEEVGANRVIVSILAGTPSARIREALGGGVRIVRVMPNLPAAVGLGMTAVAIGAGAAPGDDRLASEMLGGCGRVVALEEDLMDAFTAVAGSGPAYLFYLAEAMMRGAEACGLKDEDAEEIVRQTLLGAATLLSVDGRSASDLRTAVTSKGGTTQAATEAFDARDVMEAIERGVVAARDRGRDLAEG